MTGLEAFKARQNLGRTDQPAFGKGSSGTHVRRLKKGRSIRSCETKVQGDPPPSLAPKKQSSDRQRSHTETPSLISQRRYELHVARYRHSSLLGQVTSIREDSDRTLLLAATPSSGGSPCSHSGTDKRTKRTYVRTNERTPDEIIASYFIPFSASTSSLSPKKTTRTAIHQTPPSPPIKRSCPPPLRLQSTTST